MRLSGIGILLNLMLHLHAEQLTWWAPVPRTDNARTAICLTGTKRTSHATFPQVKEVLLQHITKISGARPDVFVVLQVDADSRRSGRHKGIDVVDYLPVAEELERLKRIIPGLTYVDLFDTHNDSASSFCGSYPVSQHKCCQSSEQSSLDLSREEVFGPWLSFFRARECFEQIKRREVQRGFRYESLVRLRPDLAICNGSAARGWIGQHIFERAVHLYHDYAWIVNRDAASDFYDQHIGQILAFCGNKRPDQSLLLRIGKFKKLSIRAPTDVDGLFPFVNSTLRASIETHTQYRGRDQQPAMVVVRNSSELRRHAARCDG